MGTVYERTQWLIGENGMDRLKNANVLVFGIGGVGGYCVEALARAGIGRLTIVDFDLIDITNLNRQIIGLQSTIGEEKVRVMAARIRDINQAIKVNPLCERVTAENIGSFHFEEFDYVIDAIDDIGGKMAIIKQAKALSVPVISSMGTGNKIRGEAFRIADISKTHTCPLAKRIRKECRSMEIEGLKVLFSIEEPARAEEPGERKTSPASISFIPSVAGLLIAGEVIRDIITIKE